MSLWSLRHLGPPLHRQVLPPVSYGTLCSKSQFDAGLRQVGAVHLACRTSVRCRSRTPVLAGRAGRVVAARRTWTAASGAA